jgi:hypothetical protein
MGDLENIRMRQIRALFPKYLRRRGCIVLKFIRSNG